MITKVTYQSTPLLTTSPGTPDPLFPNGKVIISWKSLPQFLPSPQNPQELQDRINNQPGGNNPPDPIPQNLRIPTIIYHHPDHLTSTSIDTDDQGSIIQTTDYYPYGSTRIHTTDPATDFHNDYLYTGKEQDEQTSLMYYGARYYDSSTGRFLAVDPIAFITPERFLQDPQQMNTYSYVRNNPLNAIDPDGLLTVFVHGTNPFGVFSMDGFSEEYMKIVSTDLGDDWSENFLWSGGMSSSDRTIAATQLQKFIGDELNSASSLEPIPLNIVAHSHGGNVAIEAINSGLNKKVDNLVLLGTPNRGDYHIKSNDDIGNFFNIYSSNDNVQVIGTRLLDFSPRIRSEDNVKNFDVGKNSFFQTTIDSHLSIDTLSTWQNKISGYIKGEISKDSTSKSNSSK